MDKFNKKEHFIGVDISSASLDLALTRKNGFVGHKVDNSIKGFTLIIRWIKEQG
ncbi:hypothetical protein [Flagellimonas marinaquae]|nr:hypothetical protein [Allomuricauda aquimarina]USD26854.1 hypothetical protein MJO53_08145 [Allomuricauda aquimarina]|tara:strand:+ start:373 stop:534 length:162 start_codon:yes stop_codon:yes gene_type:complete